MKQEIPKYLEIEKPLQDLIWKKYLGCLLTEEEYTQVFEIDDAILYHEFVALMDMKLEPVEPELKSKPVFSFSDFAYYDQLFQDSFESLCGQKRSI